MSISGRATHVTSMTLTSVSATSRLDWGSIERTTHCTQQTRSCTSRVSLTCCGPTASTPIDWRQQLRLETPTTYVSTTPLMDDTL